ncbi:MAG: hypothetical protein KAS23_04700, partial [Anaerohalosphaera sp.]|nr:hypothetical protein [Anaerohalosphaera sp.]
MSDNFIKPDMDNAMPFFLRAEEVASTGNYDYAVEMYIEGLKRHPDALQHGHVELRKLALLRQSRGGKKPSIKEKMKFRGGKTPADEMLNAEHLLAKDPDNLNYAATMLKSAVAGAYHDTAEWIANLIFEGNRNSEKPSLATFVLLKDSYVKLSLFTLAVSACKHAVELKPDDDLLETELRNLSAQMTLQKGKYDGTGDFTQSIWNREEQDKLHAQDKAVKSFDERFTVVDEAKKALAADPGSTEKILKMAQSLFNLETKQGATDASTLLERAYVKTKDFAFKKKQGELNLKYLRFELRILNKQLKDTPD